MSPTTWTLASVLAISAISLVGLLGVARANHKIMMGLVALAAGTLLGDSFLHILPEATADGFTTRIGLLVLGGFLLFFILESVLRHKHSHVEAVDQEHCHDHQPTAPFGILNLAGDALHNLLDGAIIAAAFLVDTSAGIATAIAVAAHEIPQELGDFAVLVRSGMSKKRAALLNLGTALFALVGALAILWLPIDAHTIESTVLPLVAGAFIYIAAADLVPELHHHGKGRDAAFLFVMVAIGIGLMALLLGLENVLPGLEEHGHEH
ncbi:MAG: ZIP family metal transporter [Thermoplasmatota archaeon]